MERCPFVKEEFQDRIVTKKSDIENKYNPNTQYYRELVYNSKGECVCIRLVSYDNGAVILENGDTRNYSHWKVIKVTCDIKNKKESFMVFKRHNLLFTSRYAMDIFDITIAPSVLTETDGSYYLLDENKKIVKVLGITTNTKA